MPLSHLFLLSHHMESNYKCRETSLLFQRHRFNHLSSRISVHTHWIICYGLFIFLLSTLKITHAASCEVVSFSHKEPRPQTLRHGTIWFGFLLGIRVKRVNKTHRHGVPSPHVWLNDHFPARLTSQQISFHDHFSLFLFLAWLGLFKLRGRGERVRERISFPLKGFVWGRLSERPL